MVSQFQLPKLPYSLNALEPIISEEIMSLHYNKHHQAYVTNLNKALIQYDEAQQKNDISGILASQSAIKFNGGGHLNHSIFWTNLAPQKSGGGQLPQGELASALNDEFGSINKLIEIVSAKAVAIQGSGWCWLGLNSSTGRLEIATCENQDPLIAKGLVPLLGIDVWEHAYYLQYKNVRPDYVKAIWEIINWQNVSERYNEATSKQRLVSSGKM